MSLEQFYKRYKWTIYLAIILCWLVFIVFLGQPLREGKKNKKAKRKKKEKKEKEKEKKKEKKQEKKVKEDCKKLMTRIKNNKAREKLIETKETAKWPVIGCPPVLLQILFGFCDYKKRKELQAIRSAIKENSENEKCMAKMKKKNKKSRKSLNPFD